MAQGQVESDSQRLESSAGVGSMLRSARLQKGLSLEAVEAETRIRRRFLEAIEEERYDQLPGVVYARGFVKLYARAVGLDPARVTELFDQQMGWTSRPRAARERPVAARERPAAGRERGASGRGGPSGPSPWWAMPDPILRALEPGRRIRHAGALALVVVTVAAAGAWVLSRSPRPPAEPTAVALPQVAPGGGEGSGPGPQPSSGTVPGTAPGTGLSTSTGPGGPGQEAVPVTPAAPPTAAEGSGPGSPAPAHVAGEPQAPGEIPSAASPALAPGASLGSVVLVARVHDRSWMEVWADGRRIFSRTAQAGEVLTWTAQQVLTVRFGRPEVVELELNGQPLGVAGSGVITRSFTAQGASGPPAPAGPAAPPRPIPLQTEPLVP